MYLFLIILFPAALAWYIISTDDKAAVSVVLTGALSSVLFCALKAFFTFMYHLASTAFLPDYAYILFGQILVPVIIVYLLFFFLSRDTVSFRIKSYFPLMCSFFSVYLPYHILAGSASSYSVFELFMKPIIYLMMLVMSALCIKFVYRSFTEKNKKMQIQWILLLLVSLLVPAAVETVWFTGLPVWLWLVLWLVYVFFAVCGYINDRERDIPLKDFSVFLPDVKKITSCIRT
jgi:hypothetical protein